MNDKKILQSKFQLIMFKIILILFKIIKIMPNECNKDIPFRLLNNTCTSQCSEDQIEIGECYLDNQIIKTQWLNNIIMLKDIENGLKYLNFMIYSNGDMIFETSPYPCSSIRVFYGLKKNGRYYFRNEVNKETPLLILNAEDGKETKYESQNNFVILNNNKEYIISIGRLESYTEIYDFENKIIFSKETSSILGYKPFNFRGSLIKLNYNNKKHYFFYECIYQVSTYHFASVFMKIEFSINEFNDIIVSDKKEVLKNYTAGNLQSCFMTEQKIIICFFCNIESYERYNILVFNQNMEQIYEENIEDNNINTDYYYYCIYYQGEVGIFLYYKLFNSNYYPYIFFKKFNIEESIFEDYFSSNNNIILDKYIFNNGYIYNDFKTFSKSKILFFSLSEDMHIIYIVVLNMFDSNKIKISYYAINAINLYNYRVHAEIKTSIFNKFIIFSSSQCPEINTDDSYGFHTSLMIFSYPNGTDENINIIKYLYENNQINKNDLIYDLYPNFIIDNNIFGYIFYSIIIQNINKKGNIDLVLSNNDKILKNNDELNKNEKIELKLNNKEFEQFELKLEYAFIVTDPEYNEYKKYPVNIDTKYGDDNEEIYNKQKELYIGKTIYFNVYLNEELTRNCNIGCDFCLLNNINKCVICKYNFSFINNDKICQKYPCSNEDIINNKCIHEKITIEQAKEVYNNLVTKINNKNFNYTIILTENYIFQISTIEEQKNNVNKKISSIDFGECEEILKKNTNGSLIVLKTDIKSDDLSSTYVLFEVYDYDNSKNKLDLEICDGVQIEISAPKMIENDTLDLFTSLNDLGYNIFNPNDSFYNDICTPFTTKNDKDILLSDRWEDIYISNNKQYLCQENCIFNSYNITNQKITCNCIINEKNANNNFEDINFDFKEIIEGFQKTLKFSNFKVLKCYKYILDFKKFIKNIGSMIITIIIIIFFFLMIIYCFTGKKKIIRFLSKILTSKSIEKIKIKTKNNVKKINIKKTNLKKKENPPLKKLNINSSIINTKIKNSFVSDNHLLNKKNY